MTTGIKITRKKAIEFAKKIREEAEEARLLSHEEAETEEDLVRTFKKNGEEYIEFRCIVKVDGPGRYFIHAPVLVTRSDNEYPEELFMVNNSAELSIGIGEKVNGVWKEKNDSTMNLMTDHNCVYDGEWLLCINTSGQGCKYAELDSESGLCTYLMRRENGIMECGEGDAMDDAINEAYASGRIK